MTKLRNMIIAAIAIVALPFSAHSFEGLSIGTVYSMADFDTSGTETVDAGLGVNKHNSVTKSGSADYGSLFAEYTFAQGTSLGIEYIPASAEIGKANRTQTAPVSGGASEDGSGLLSVKAKASDHISLYVEPTFMMSDAFGVYVKGGASKVTITPQVAEPGGQDIIQSTYAAQDVYGTMMGIGAKYYWGNMFVKLEHVTTEYGEYAFQSTTGDKNTITADIEQTATRVALAYNF
jgi:hypothetical protein